jgi:hypothetical protein
MSDLQTFLDLRAAATPGPLFAECIDQFGPDGKSWLIPFAVRSKYGENALNFDDDEPTAKFVAAAFTEVPRIGAALQRAEALLADMEHLIERDDVTSSDFAQVAVDLRAALKLDGTQ